jgi:hypothetical protein
MHQLMQRLGIPHFEKRIKITGPTNKMQPFREKRNL